MLYAFAGLIFLSGAMVYPLREMGLGVWGPWPAFAHAFAFAALWSWPSGGRLRVFEGVLLVAILSGFELTQVSAFAPMLSDVPFLGPYARHGTFAINDLVGGALGVGLWAILACFTQLHMSERGQ